MPESASAPAPVIAAHNLHVHLSGTEILHGVDLTADAGEAVAVLGGNGSGKSTLIRALVGAVPVSSGSVRLFGAAPSRAVRARVGYVPQRISATSGVAASAREVVISGLLGARQLRPPRNAVDRATEALESVGVGALAGRDVASLSGGEQQRVLIARALVRDPQVLILDEPMAGVDLASQEALAAALTARKAAGTALVIVLHEVGFLGPLIDRAIVLEHGCVTHAGEPPRALGVHALPGHDHEHPHADRPDAPASPFSWEMRP